MTIVPPPVKRTFRRFEIVVGLLCLAAGAWMLTQFALWLSGSVPQVEVRSMTDAALLLVQSIYLLGFSGNVLFRGSVARPLGDFLRR
jgi:hypothetical protein